MELLTSRFDRRRTKAFCILLLAHGGSEGDEYKVLAQEAELYKVCLPELLFANRLRPSSSPVQTVALERHKRVVKEVPKSQSSARTTEPVAARDIFFHC